VNNTSSQHNTAQSGDIFGQLNHQDVEEFYIYYQCWNLQRQIENIQHRLIDVRRQMIENNERRQEVQPTAIELATLARLQSNGVRDIDLLDRMLERGEAWLDRTMQRLDYLEQLDDLISDDYTQWCQHALEGAYDWIDSVLDGNATTQPSTATPGATSKDVNEAELIEATEELFLQKINNDEDEAISQAVTMKRPAITTADPEEAVLPAEDTAPEVPLTMENSSTSANEQPSPQEPIDISPVAQTSSSPQSNVTPEYVSYKRPGFMKRFFGKIWSS
jgi:hypothetical protein